MKSVSIISLLLFIVFLFASCGSVSETSSSAQEPEFLESWLGYKYSSQSETGVIVFNNDFAHLVSCPSENDTLTLPTVFDKATPIAGIADHAFCNNSRITQLIIPNEYKTIGHYSFMNCENLETIMIGNGLSYVGELAFADCSKISCINVAEDNPHFYASEG